VTGLTSADFSVFEDDQPQTIATFAAGEFPLSVALGIDRSFSMQGRPLALAKTGARALAAALRPGDQLMVVAIGSETTVLAPLSADRATALAALEPLDAWGTTPLYDATIAAIEQIQAATGRRALILLSDGNDRYSRASAADVVARARASDVLIYPVATGRARPPIFAELATVTGGRSVFLNEARELQSTLTAIARELRLQYLLGYSAPNGARGPAEAHHWRSIRVEVASRPDVRIRHRTGYFSR
jgi:Ca-activated chloride channel family protein